MELIPPNIIPVTVENQIQCIITNKNTPQILEVIRYFEKNNISVGIEEIVGGVNMKIKFMKDLRNIIFRDKRRFCAGVSGLESKSFEYNDLILYSVANVGGKYYLTGFATININEGYRFVLEYLCGDLLLKNMGKSFLNFIKKMVYSLDKRGTIELESVRNEVTINFYKSQYFRNTGNHFLWKYHNHPKDRANIKQANDIFLSHRATIAKYLQSGHLPLESYYFITPTSFNSMKSPRSPRRTRKDYFREGFFPLARKPHVYMEHKRAYTRKTI